MKNKKAGNETGAHRSFPRLKSSGYLGGREKPHASTRMKWTGNGGYRDRGREPLTR